MRRNTALPLFILTTMLLACGVVAQAAAGSARGKMAAAARNKKTAARRQGTRAVARPKVDGELLPAARAGLERKDDVKGRTKKFSARNKRAQTAAARAARGDSSVRFDEPAAAAEWFLKKRLPKGEKVLPVERYFEAKEKIKKMRRHSSARGRNLPSQEEAGDADPDLSGGDGEFPNGTGGGGAGDGSASTSGALGTWTPLGPGNIGGRTRALIIHPTNPDVMYAAAVAGGVWKTTNAGASWTPLNDFLANTAVTSMAMDPADPDTIYAGTGEGFFNADGVRGAGIFKTTDAGATWTRLAFTANNVNFHYVNDVVVSPVNPQNVYAATRSGVWRSLDGGATWTQVLISNAANGANGAMDLVIRTDNQTTDYVFAAVGTFAQSRIHRNVDAGGAGVWEVVHTEAAMGRTSLALAPSNQNVIYAMSSSNVVGTAVPGRTYLDGLHAVFRSSASGDPGSWTARVRNSDPNKLNTVLLSNTVNAFNSTPQCGGGADAWFNQGWYDNIITVDPVDENVVWAGGVDLFRSDDGGANWGLASHWWFTGNGVYPNANHPQYAHADQHLIVFHPNYDGSSNQTMFAANDGGLFRTTNARGNLTTTPAGICGFAYQAGAQTTAPDPVLWQTVNNGYAVTQFYHGLPYPNGTTYFGGTQDNGTNRGTDATGINGWARIFGGDGGYVAVDPNNTNIIYAETTNLSFRKSTNGGTTFTTRITGITEPGGNFLFIAPFHMDPNNSQRLYIAGAVVWRTDVGAVPVAPATTAWRQASAFLGTRVSAIATAPSDSNFAIVGTQTGRIFRTTVATTATGATVWPSALPRTDFVSWVAFDPTNKNIAYATYSSFNSGANVGHVWKTTDAGATWARIDGTGQNALPDIPAHSIVVDPNNPQRLYVGTDLGVFVTLDGGVNWARETSGFSNVPVESLSVQNNNGVTSIFAFTHGRGVYKVVIPASCANVSPTSQQFYSPGAGGTVNVAKAAAATGACDWNAVSNSDFITISSGASGTGTGAVDFAVAQNTTGAPRTGTLTVAGLQITISQDAAPFASDDTATTDEDNPVSVNVRSNDNDPDGDTLTVTAVTQGANGAVAIAGGGTNVTYTPNQDFFGSDTFTYTVDDGHGGQSTANVNVTVTAVNDAPVFSVSPATQTVQYSDAVAPVNVSVSDVDDATSALTLEVTSALPAGLAAAPAGPGSLTISGNVAASAGAYEVGLRVTDGSGTMTTSDVQFVVAKEAAETAYTGDAAVVTAGPTITAATFRLGAHLTQQADGAAGDISLARVTFELFKSNNLTNTPDRTVANVTVNSAGDALTTISNVAADTYVVKVKVDAANGYWVANPVGMEVVNVTVGTNDQRTNGGGWVADTASASGKSNFGFTVRNEKGTPKGNFSFVTRGTDGFTYVVKSNAWQGGFLNFAGEPGTSALTRSSFKGRCTVQKVDPVTGLIVQSWGGYGFTVDARDGDLLDPRQADGIAILIQDGAGAVWKQLGTPASLLTLGGGNVQVKGK